MAYNIFEGYIQDSWKASNRLTHRRRPPHVAPGRLVRAQRRGHGGVRSRALQLAGAGHDVPRPHLDGRQPDVPTSGVEVQSIFFSPRVGFAYDLSGDGSTLLRGGYGMFNFHDAQGPYSAVHRPALRRDVHQRRPTAPACRTSRTSTRTGSRASAAAILASRRQAAADPELELHGAAPAAVQMTIEAGYVGSKSDRLLNDGIDNLNNIPLGAMINDPNGDPRITARTASTAAHRRCRSTRTTRTTTRCRCC